MSDRRTQALIRAGDPLAFAAQWRRVLPELRVVCGRCEGSGNFYVHFGKDDSLDCPRCDGRGTTPVPDDERLRLLAYVGHAGARGLVACDCVLHLTHGYHGTMCPQRDCESKFFDVMLSGLPPFLRTACALGAARLWCADLKRRFPYHAHTAEWGPAEESLDACAAWLRDPTAERREAWHKAHRLAWPGGEGIDMFVLSPVGLENGWVAARIQTCARLHGDTPAVHEASRAQTEALLLHGEEMAG